MPKHRMCSSPYPLSHWAWAIIWLSLSTLLLWYQLSHWPITSVGGQCLPCTAAQSSWPAGWCCVFSTHLKQIPEQLVMEKQTLRKKLMNLQGWYQTGQLEMLSWALRSSLDKLFISVWALKAIFHLTIKIQEIVTHPHVITCCFFHSKYNVHSDHIS